MEYLIRARGKRSANAAAHLWDGKDTVCRMASTGGLGRNWGKKYTIVEDRGNHRICSMCQTVSTGKVPRLTPRKDQVVWHEDLTWADIERIEKERGDV
jgi:hypothetical protein